MSEFVLERDESPELFDVCEALENATPQETFAGWQLGQLTNTEDDDDNGIPAMRSLMSSERDRAMAKAQAFKKVLLAHGVPEVSIELLPGRPNPHGSWDATFIVSDMSHHTVSRLGPNLTPVLSLCKKGRSDLPGPLCNGYGGYDLCYRIITFGYANHPGAGGPKTVPALTAGTFTIPKDSARRYSWGTEWEGGLNEADWDKVLKNPRNGKKMTMREFMGRANAAIQVYHEIAKGAHMEHSTWTSRKIDRLHYTAAKGIAEKSPYLVQKPKPPKPLPLAHEHVVFSPSRFDRTPQSLGAAVGLYLPGRTKVLLTEVANNARIKAVKGIPGVGLVNPEDDPAWTVPNADECAILYLQSHSKLVHKAAPILTRKPNDVWKHGFRGTVGIFETRRTGQTHAMLVAHMPARVQGKSGLIPGINAEAYRDAVDRMSIIAKRWLANTKIDQVSIWADWNLDWREKWVREYLGPKFPGLKNTWEDGQVPTTGGTHDHRLIDYGFTNMKVTSTELMTDDASSDHRPQRSHQLFRPVFAKIPARTWGGE